MINFLAAANQKGLSEIETQMMDHKANCDQPFHRYCREFRELGREYVRYSGTIQSWDPFEGWKP